MSRNVDSELNRWQAMIVFQMICKIWQVLPFKSCGMLEEENIVAAESFELYPSIAQSQAPQLRWAA